jgi:hypothetical protein
LINEKKITFSNHKKVKLLFGIPFSSTLTPFLLGLSAVKRLNRRFIMIFLQLFFGGLILLLFYLGHKQ